MNMRVLQINSVCGIRSTGRICTDLADVLLQDGHECKIAYGRESVPEKYRKIAVRIGNDLDAKMHALQSRIFDNAGFGSRLATEKFIEWVKEYNPDIDMLNGLLINWNLSQIAFMGIIHSHWDKEELSAKDIYMARKLLSLNSLKHVLMPVFVISKRCIYWYTVSGNDVKHMAFRVVDNKY